MNTSSSLLFKLSLLIILFSVTITNQIPWLLIFSLLSLIPFLLNFWLVPGGFAWRKNPMKNYPKLPGPIGWPIFGSIPLMGSIPHRKLAEIASSLGATRLMAFSLGTTRMIISSHPETAKEILCGPAFSDRPVKVSAKILMFERAIGFAPSGEYWKQLRRIAATHMFSPKRILSLEGLRQRLSDEMIKGVFREMREKGIVEMRGILGKGALCNVVESVFGRSLMSLEGEELRVMVEEGYELIGKFNWVDYFNFGFLDFHGVKRRCHKLAERVKGLVGQIIEERRGDGDYSERSDFLSVLLSLPEEDQLSDSDMVAILWSRI
ncbi:Cytochrome P450 [Macleaya cordata]|uniref:Cytochrome P450 n=1 Tax=Macleaya cordata TaxID=56857 RepID=A0A200QGC8_MACCD|nr:Cytochrome P450 [Macleaya cordata]